MARSLGFAAYRALARRGPTPAVPDWPPRPDGELIWLHAAEANSMARVIDLAHRLIAARFGITILLSQSEGATAPVPDTPHLIPVDLPSEHPGAVDAFVQHWRVDLAFWLWGDLRPNLITATATTGIPMILADAGKAGFNNRRDRWLSEVPRQVLACFHHVLARSPEAEARLRQLGCKAERLELRPPLVTGGQPPHADHSDVDMLSQALSGRPVWFAAGVTADEVPAMITAQRHAQRMSHRLLLIVEPRDGAAQAAVIAACAADDLRLIRWSEQTNPDDTTAILLADISGETGLWLRVSPIVFLGGSLMPGQRGQNPFSAASLGAAVLYGPSVGEHLDAYTRLANAGAARIVNDADSLGVAVTRLVAPDQAAKMAMAGWDVVTQGASTVDRITELMQISLDAAQGRA